MPNLRMTTIESEDENYIYVETYAIYEDDSGNVLDSLLIRTDRHPQ